MEAAVSQQMKMVSQLDLEKRVSKYYCHPSFQRIREVIQVKRRNI